MTPAWPLVVVKSLLSLVVSPENSDVAPAHRHDEQLPVPRSAVLNRGIQIGIPSYCRSPRQRRMFAPGATACAHSTSRASSVSQFTVPGPAGSTAGNRYCRSWKWFALMFVPDWLYTVKKVEATSVLLVQRLGRVAVNTSTWSKPSSSVKMSGSL